VHQEKVRKESNFDPAVAVIVPVLNGEATIELLLESLLKIDHPKEKIEIVIVDGNSTDKTRDIVAKYPVKLLVEKREGPNVARNTGIKHTNSEIIAFTDSDCIVSKDWIKKIIEDFRDPKIGCVGGDVKGLNDDFLSKYADNSAFPLIRTFKKRKELYSTGPFEGCPVGCNMAFRRKAFEDAGGFDESIRYSFEEDEIIERICKTNYKLILDPQVLVWHKHRSNLKDILKQSFKYGKGTGKLLKRPKNQRLVQRWLFINISASIQIILIIGLVAFLITMAKWEVLFLIFFASVLLPLFGFMALYAYRAQRSKEYKSIFIYPLIDFLRALAFCSGEIYGFAKRK
jgi:cellulose synthase/poly-beta-1,6-N-acetylglucosamine synthase-like glycosyltransferase